MSTKTNVSPYDFLWEVALLVAQEEILYLA
jgi:hypothetical protein